MNTEKIFKDYERDGVVRVKKLLSTAEVDQVKSELRRYMNDVLPSLPEGDRTFENDD